MTITFPALPAREFRAAVTDVKLYEAGAAPEQPTVTVAADAEAVNAPKANNMEHTTVTLGRPKRMELLLSLKMGNPEGRPLFSRSRSKVNPGSAAAL
jgi:hypothetical protein